METKMKRKTKILVFIFKFYYGTSRPPYKSHRLGFRKEYFYKYSFNVMWKIIFFWET